MFFLECPNFICGEGKNRQILNRDQTPGFDQTFYFVSKVWTFWEGHKIWKNLPLLIWRYSVASNFKWKIFSNFVAFSEYLNFIVLRRIAIAMQDRSHNSIVFWIPLHFLSSSSSISNVLVRCGRGASMNSVVDNPWNT